MLFRLSSSTVYALPFLSLIAACSSSPTAANGDFAPPAWVHQPSRTLDGGYIVYVASAQDRSADRAALKAEAQALEDLVNECSFAPKGTRIEDRYQRKDGSLQQSYAKVAVEFQLCEEAKKTVEPNKIQALASAPFTEELKRYQDLVAQESQESQDPSASESIAANPMLADTHSPSNSSPSDLSSTPHVRWIIRDEPQFWVIRQEVAVQKQGVILSPLSAYPPNAPQTQQVASQLTGASQEIQKYEASNPRVKTGSWSNYQRARKVSRITPPARTINRRLEEPSRQVASAKRRPHRRRRF